VLHRITAVPGTPDVAGTEYRLDAPGMLISRSEVKICPGRVIEAPSGSPRTGSGYSLRQSYPVRAIAFTARPYRFPSHLTLLTLLNITPTRSAVTTDHPMR
jgi:hypothetical protein